MVKKVIIGLSIQLLSFGIMAADLNCIGKIEYVSMLETYGLYVKTDWNTSPLRLCDLNGSFRGIAADTCKYWASSIQTSMYVGKDVRFWYKDQDTSATDCASIPGNSSAPKLSGVYLLNQ